MECTWVDIRYIYFNGPQFTLWCVFVFLTACKTPSSTPGNHSGADSLNIVKITHDAKQLIERRDLKNACVLLDTALALGKRTKGINMPLIHYQQGIVSAELGRFDKALDHFKHSLSYFEADATRRRTLAQVHHRMGQAYYRLHDFEKSLTCFDKVKDGDMSQAGQIELHMDRALSLAGQKHFSKSLKILDGLKERISDDSLKGKFMLAKGKVAMLNRDLRGAEKFFTIAVEAGHNVNQPRVWIESDLFLSQIFLKTKNFSGASAKLQASEIEADQLGLADLRLLCYSLTGELQLARGNYSSASQYQERFLHLRDQLYGEELRHKMSALQVEFKERHQVQKIKEQEELMRLKEQSLQQQRSITIVIGFICFLLVIMFVILALNYRATRKMNSVLASIVNDKTYLIKKIYAERDEASHLRVMQINEIARQLKATLASLKGMCHIGHIDSKTPISNKKLMLIEETVAEIASVVTPLIRNSSEFSGREFSELDSNSNKPNFVRKT